MLTLSRFYRTFLFIAAVLFTSCSMAGNSVKNERILLTHWQYHLEESPSDSTQNYIRYNINSNDWMNLKLSSEMPENPYEKFIWLSTRLPEWKGTSPALYVGQVDHFMQVYLDGKLIFQTGDSTSLYDAKFIGWNQVLVELPYYRQGSVIDFRIMSSNGFSRLNQKIILGSSIEITKAIFSENILTLFFASFFFLTSIIIFVIFVTNRSLKLLLAASFFMLPLSFFEVSNSLFVQLMLPSPSIYYNVDFLSLIGATIGGFFAIAQIVISRYKKIIYIIFGVHLVFLFFSIFTSLVTKITYLEILPFFLVFTTIDMLISLIVMVLSAKAGNYNSKILIAGFSIFFFFATIEIVIYFAVGLYSDFGYNIRVLHIGTVFFVVALIWIAVREYITINKQKEAIQRKEQEAVKRENEARRMFTMKLLESQENERNRIALELHDSLGQELLIIKNRALIGLKSAGEFSKEKLHLEKISENASKVLKLIRTLSHSLRPPELDKLGITETIHCILISVQESAPFFINSDVENIDNIIPKGLEINLIRILQESLNNIEKYAQATEINVCVKKTDQIITVSVADNGLGFDLNAIKPGIGLEGLKERARILNGTLIIDSGRMKGTTITVQIPVAPKGRLIIPEVDDVNKV